MITFMLGASLFALVGVSMLICTMLDRVFRSHSSVKQLPAPESVVHMIPNKVTYSQPGEYIRLLDNTLLYVQKGGEKDPYIIAAMEEVEEICSR